MVPTPPILGVEIEFEDDNGSGSYEEGEDTLISETEDVIISGKSQDVSFISGVFQSFGDAPGGFSEELKEFTYALGAEYQYQDSFALTAGDVILVQSGDFVKVVNESEHDQLTYLRVFDRDGWRV